MNSLSTRLLAAFVVVILLVLAIVSLVLLALLRNSPLVERHGLTQLQQSAQAAIDDGLLWPGMTGAELREATEVVAATYNVRVLLATVQGEVVVDSAGPDAPGLNFGRFRLARRDAAFPGSLVGRVRDDRLRLWQYIARPAGRDHLLIFAAPPPRFAALAFFAEYMLVPLLEAAGVATLVAVVLAVVISRSIAHPLQRMAGVAQSIARGRYDATAPTNGPREVRVLGESINSMARQVQASQTAQRDFVANVSHELKTPLTSIQGFAQAMLDGAVDSQEGIRRSATIIHAEAERMRRLVEGLLDLARLDAGLQALNRTPLDLRAVLAAVVDRFALRAKESGVDLRADFPPALPTMVGDADRLAQVFTNLLDNALKHTLAGGRVRLSATALPGGVEVVVADTGSGVPPEELSRIFERFYQVDKSRVRPGGAGLGLTISKEIVDAHGGSLRVESHVGQGTTFTVRLPTTQPDDSTVARQR